MNWDIVARLLLTYGPEVAEMLIKKHQSGATVTLEEWAPIQAIAAKTPRSQLDDALARNGIDANSPEAQALLAMLK